MQIGFPRPYPFDWVLVKGFNSIEVTIIREKTYNLLLDSYYDNLGEPRSQVHHIRGIQTHDPNESDAMPQSHVTEGSTDHGQNASAHVLI